jgi:hypothetical protein
MVGRKVFSLPVELESAVVDFDMFGWRRSRAGRLLTNLCQGQEATVLQLPAAPRTAEEAEEQKRVAVVA